MSLLSDAMEEAAFIDKTTVSDGYGGIKTVWQVGAFFNAAITYDSSLAARRAEKEGVRNVYTITTARSITLMAGDIIRREKDKKYFKITSDGMDKATPQSTSLDMRVVSAEMLESLPE